MAKREPNWRQIPCPLCGAGIGLDCVRMFAAGVTAPHKARRMLGYRKRPEMSEPVSSRSLIEKNIVQLERALIVKENEVERLKATVAELERQAKQQAVELLVLQREIRGKDELMRETCNVMRAELEQAREALRRLPAQLASGR